MAVSFEIRPLVEEDIPAALALWQAAEGVEVSEGDSPSDLVRYLQRNPDLSFGITAAGALVGAVLAGHDGRRGYLYHLAVASSCQRQGLGRKLVTAAIDGLRGAGIRRVLILVATDNPAGHAFWRDLGWEDMGFALPLGLDI